MDLEVINEPSATRGKTKTKIAAFKKELDNAERQLRRARVVSSNNGSNHPTNCVFQDGGLVSALMLTRTAHASMLMNVVDLQRPCPTRRQQGTSFLSLTRLRTMPENLC